MDNEQYISFCRNELRRVFENTKAGTPDDKLKYRVEGLMLAASLLGLCSKQHIQQVMEEEHKQVFGESIAERMERKSLLNVLKNEDPDAYFDIPAIERRGK